MPDGFTSAEEVLAASSAPATPVNTVADELTTRRIRDLMSAADKARADREKAQAALIELQNTHTTKLSEYQTVLDQATSTTSTLLQQKAEWEAEQKRLLAEKAQLLAEQTKMRLLAQKPELLAYADYIPAGDEASVQAAIDRFVSLRQADIERNKAPAATVPTAPSTEIRGLYPQNAFVPPVTAPTPSPVAAAYTIDSLNTEMNELRTQVRNGQINSADYQAKMQKLIPVAEQLARQQYSA